MTLAPPGEKLNFTSLPHCDEDVVVYGW